MMDYDYIDKLSPEERKFLNKFTAEYYISNFDNGDEEDMLDDRKEAYNMNNRRNRDAFGVSKANHMLDYGFSPKEGKTIRYNNDEEDRVITEIALKRVKDKIESTEPDDTDE